MYTFESRIKLLPLLVLFGIVVFMNGCAKTPKQALIYQPAELKKPSLLYRDDLFITNNKQRIETEDQIFYLTPEIKTLIRNEVDTKKPFHSAVHELIDVIFSKEQIGLAYLNSASLTASETYLNKQANCLSLTILAYAIADELNISAKFQLIQVPEYWINNSGYNLLAGHVNVILSDNVQKELSGFIVKPDTVTIDFDPYTRKKSFPTSNLNKKEVIAYFYTNKAAQAIINNEHSLAYAYLKEATSLSPKYSSAWGNLGVLYKFMGEYELAIASYERAITLKTNNYTAINNLSFAFDSVGRTNEAVVIRKKLHNARINNPYYHALLGNKAYSKLQFKKAESHFKQAILLDSSEHEFHFGLAKSFSAQNKLTLASKTLEKAIKVSPFYDVDQRYLAKLNFLNQQ